jgi:hypothetical protein
MPNWCNNYITISGNKEKMKPLYDYFKSSQDELDKFNKERAVIHKENPEAWKTIDEIHPNLQENLVMSTLVPHDEDYERIKASGEYLLNPQVNFYGTKWDFDFSEANIHDITEECITFGPQTAWSPPSEFCRRLTAKYDVQVEIKFDEPGIGFVGEEEFEGGEMTGQVIYEDYLEGMYNLEPDSFWENEVYNNMEYCKEEGKTFEETLQDMFSFITKESEIKQLKEVYDEVEVDIEE